MSVDRPRAVTGLVVLIVAVAGCGANEPAPVRVEDLATEQFSLIGRICQAPAQLRDDFNRIEQTVARDQLSVLLRALRDRPDARVRTSYASHSGPGSEILSIRELAERDAYSGKDLQVALDATQAPKACVVRVRSRLQRAIDASR